MGVFKRIRTDKDGTRNPYWYIRYSLNGKEKWESIGKVGIVTKTVAQSILEDRKRKVRLRQLDMIGAEIPTLQGFIPEYIKYVRDVKKIRSHDRSRQAVFHFARFYGLKKLNEINIEDIDIYKQNRLNEGIKLGTIARELVVIRHMFNQAKKWNKFFGENPVSKSGMPEINDQKERVLTIDEEVKLLSKSPAYLTEIILIGLNTGMRLGEILGLKWQWVDLEEGIITLPQTNTKNKKMRRIPINPIVRKIFLERKIQFGLSEYVFPSETSKTGHISWLRRSFSTACKRANIQGLRFHDLRHTAATRLVESGIPLHAVAKLLGHSTVRVTERYSHPESSVREAVEILGNFNTHRSQKRSHENLEN